MKGTCTTLAAIVLLAGSGLPAVGSPNLPSDTGPGASLENRVLHELRMLPYYNVFDDLRFVVNGDQVTLSGEVTNPVVKTDALNSVKHLAGVARVDDQIEVLPVSDFDPGIRMRTYFAIYGYGPLQKYSLGAWPSIHILVRNGNVRLVGVVDSKADRDMAYIRANGVPGVFSVFNDLQVGAS